MALSTDIRSLENKLKTASTDNGKLRLLIELAEAYRKIQVGKANHYWQEALSIVKGRKDLSLLGDLYYKIAQFHYLNESYDNSIHYNLESIQVYESTGDLSGIGKNLLKLGATYQMIHRFGQAIKQFRRAHQLFRRIEDQQEVTNTEFCLGNAYNWDEQLDKAGKYLRSALKTAQQLGYQDIEMKASASLGILHTKTNRYKLAEEYFTEALHLVESLKHPTLGVQIKKSLGNLYNEAGEYNKAIEVLSEALRDSEMEEPKSSLVLIHEFLSNSYEKKGDFENALNHFKKFNELSSKKLNEENIHRIAIIENEYKTQSLAKEAEIHRLKNVELTQAYEELQSAQQLLLSNERLALLGQLTTGIAHEIQNPLNFVKNFAEVSSELVHDLFESRLLERIEIAKEDFVYLTSILNDLEQNNEKIRKHGMRAANIVKSMLMHAREKFTEKQYINISALLNESIELATQGLQPSDQKSEIRITKKFSNTDQEIKIYPNNMGRVFLNIMNNAFYAINEKRRETDDSYVPELKITTRRNKNFFDITFKNNGLRIPVAIRGKIFNPFFTTKKTGEGTGLGLSISQDIVVKEHGGQLLMTEDKKGYTQFKVRLPL